MRIRNLRVTPLHKPRMYSGLGQSADCVANQQAFNAKQAELNIAMAGGPATMSLVPKLQAELAVLGKSLDESCAVSSGGSAFKDFTAGLTSLLTAAAPAAAQIYSADQARRAVQAANKPLLPSPFSTPVVINAPQSSSNTGLIVAGILGVAALVTIGLMMSRKPTSPSPKKRRIRRKH